MNALMDLIDSPTIENIRVFAKMHAQLPQIDVPVEHLFADGLYARPMLMHAGESVVGATHGKQHLCIVVGDCIVADGHDRKTLHGLNYFVSEPGAKRAIIALTDLVWITIHATKLKNVADIEREVLLPEDEPNRFFPDGIEGRTS